MKNYILFFIIFAKQCFAQSIGPFSYGTYLPYDDVITIAGSNSVSYQDFDYRDNVGDYDGYASLSIFYYANNRVEKKLSKPFVFVEGISFNKSNIDDQNYFYNEYFFQLGNRSPETSSANIATLNQMVFSGPGFNPFVGYSTFNWATLVTGIDAEGLAFNDPLSVQKSPELLNKLLCAGYDIVFIDFLNGEHYIEANGEALYNAISRIKQMMVDSGSTEKMVVCGASMGGLVARYAIRKHELAGHTDWFSHFISFDSPQQGANINLSLQYTLKHLSSFPLIPDDAKESYSKVTCPSASQLVKYSCLSTNVQPPIVYTTPSMSLERAQLVLNPNMISWPTSCRRVSITNGSRYGYVQNGGSYTNGCQVFDGEGAIEIELYSLPNTMTTSTLITNVHVLNNCPFLSGSLWAGLSKQVYVSNCLPLDNLAGSYRNDLKDLEESMPQWMNATGLFPMPVCNLLDADDYFQNFANPSNTCFIPLLSSAGIIDFDNSVSNSQAITQALFQGKEKFEDPQHTVSHFDVVYAPIYNQTHVEITDENIEWVMTELVANQHIVFQNETIPNGTYLARESIKAGWDVDKYGDQCAQIFQPAMHPQYTYSPNYIQTCGPVVTQTGTVVVLHAGSRIELHPGFSSTDAFYFEASIMDGLGCGTQSGARYADEGYSSGANNTGLVAGVQPMINLEEKNMQADTEKITFVLAPNPTRGGVVLKSNCSEAKLIEIRDVQGRLLKRTESNLQNTNLDLTDLPAGLYYVSSVGDNHRFVSKVLKE
jgi:hypothetical protein